MSGGRERDPPGGAGDPGAGPGAGGPGEGDPIAMHRSDEVMQLQRLAARWPRPDLGSAPADPPDDPDEDAGPEAAPARGAPPAEAAPAPRPVTRSVPVVAPRPARSAKPLWIAAGVAAAALAAGIAWEALRSRGAAPDVTADRAVWHEAGTGPAREVAEIHGAFRGFSLLVDSTPPGAAVLVDGEERGRTPAMMNLQCREGAPVTVRLVRAGYAPWEHTAPCGKDAILKLAPRLNKARQR